VIPPTVDLETAARTLWDVLVIGAGPAGTLAARQLALAGQRVLLVDSKSFPRGKVCGACLNGQALSILKSAGLKDLPLELGGVPLNRLDVRVYGRKVAVPLPEGVAVSRKRFDAELVRAATGAGTEFLPETSASLGALSAEGPEECRTVALRHRDAAPIEARARVVLAADGLAHASLRDHEQFDSQVSPGSRIGVGGHLASFPASYERGTVYMAVGRPGYVGLVRVEEGQLNIAGALLPEYVRGAGSVPEAVGSLISEAGLAPIAALADAAWHGTIALTRRTRRPADRRVFVLGDAAGYVEPFTGEGIAWAFAAATAVTPFVLRGLSNWDERLESEWHAALRKVVFRRQRWSRLFAFASRHPILARLVQQAVALFPSAANPIIRRVNQPPDSSAVQPPVQASGK
jgi:flavin-dependent dehydrogenase